MMRRLISIAGLFVLLIGIPIGVNAADVPYAFNLKNTGTTFKTYTGANCANKKVYSGDPGTIKINSIKAPGNGYLLRLSYKNWQGQYKAATYSYWRKNKGTSYASYLSGQNKTNRNYYISGRIDNDYAGPYPVTGSFNSDKT